ncbi:hypothetical protein GJ654_18690 [Rhodoblastus acidophilus]|uniref:Uncharacterized protein n=1 Tax=Rhodoblastus acidophilus TaxID=1074 RepID=A0A6N8DV26_RHOAC|nr:hypothetical protein [Rhodoblastus acidophilus]MCW2276356.1 putative nucleotide-binding protein [Rhodoblastus acidophilus]MTV33011.1 hypothetical protein [Rhodoblastus acidophilus]
MTFDANDTAKDLLLAGLLQVLDRVAAEGGETVAMKIAADIHAACDTFGFPGLNAEQAQAVRRAFDVKMAALEQSLLNAARKGGKPGEG